MKFEVPHRQPLASGTRNGTRSEVSRHKKGLFGPVKQRLSGETFARNNFVRSNTISPDDFALFGACEGLLLSGVWHSVQERGLWCTEYAFGAKKGLLVYATRFQRHSVQKTGSSCTEWKFGAKKDLLVYGRRSEARRTADSTDREQLPHRTQLRNRGTASCYTERILESAKNGFLLYRTHPQKRGTAASYCTRRIFESAKNSLLLESAKNNPRSKVSRHKKRVPSKSIKTFGHPLFL